MQNILILRYGTLIKKEHLRSVKPEWILQEQDYLNILKVWQQENDFSYFIVIDVFLLIQY